MKNTEYPEEWRVVESKGVTLMVSNTARVKVPAHSTSYTRIRSGKEQVFSAKFGEREVAATRSRNGYLEVAPMIHGKRTKHLLHRLVGMAFVPGYEDGLSINHIDGNKLNNRPSNLEWVSLARNSQHAWEAGLVDLRGDNHPSRKLSSRQVVYMRRLLAKGVSAHTLAVIAGVSDATVYLIRDGARWPTVTGGKKVIAEQS